MKEVRVAIPNVYLSKNKMASLKKKRVTNKQQSPFYKTRYRNSKTEQDEPHRWL